MSAAIEIHPATADDAAGVRRAVELLIRELSGNDSYTLTDFEATYEALCSRPELGGVLVARDATGAVVGVLDYSLQMALRTGGRYAIIQDLWADPAVRGAGIGRELVEALGMAVPGDVSRIEVGLAPPSYAAVDRTTAFYAGLGFTHMGDRFKMDVDRSDAAER